MSTIQDLVQWVINAETAMQEQAARVTVLEAELSKERARNTELQDQLTKAKLLDAVTPSDN